MANIIQTYSPYLLLGFLFAFLIFLIWNIALQLQFSRLKKRSFEFFGGNKVNNLEELLLSQTKSIKLLDKDIQELYTISNQINALAFKGFHKLGVVRFNPFKDVGGDQSFSVALLNGKNDGLTISSLFTREGSRVYTKTITGGVSEKHPLTEEEKEAIQLAISSKNLIEKTK
ncbi:MAG: DUF4446 family protein [Parcubacteria group bacterium]